MNALRPHRLLPVAAAALLLPTAWAQGSGAGEVPSHLQMPVTKAEVFVGTRSGDLVAGGTRSGDLVAGDLPSALSSDAGSIVVAHSLTTPSPSPSLDRPKRSGGAVIVYLIVLLGFVALYLFTRDRLRRR